jgi:nitrate reductase delta subunit
MRTLKVLSLLLAYPFEGLGAEVPELRGALAQEGLLSAAQQKLLGDLLGEIEHGDLLELQERWVFLFDRTRSLSLHLFEHVHGEGRDRGQAMVDLAQLYEVGGLARAGNELPDYLPLFLEYLSTRPFAEARGLLGETVHILVTLAERLEKRRSSYAGALRALAALAKAKPKPEELAAVVPDDGVAPDDLEALDAVWEEEPVTFGPAAAAACGVDGLASKLRAGRRPAPGLDLPVGPRRPVVTHSSKTP